MKIYTKTGDRGETSLWGGRKVKKSDLRIDAYGTVDELNAWIGLLADQFTDSTVKAELLGIQDRLFAIGASLSADPQNPKLSFVAVRESDIPSIESAIDRMDAHLEPLKNFILPGGHPLVSHCHLARTVCRRAERVVVALMEAEPGDPQIVIYLNRLSDYLFTAGRFAAHLLGIGDRPWIPDSDPSRTD